MTTVLTVSDRDLPLEVAVYFDRWDGDRAQYGYTIHVEGLCTFDGDDLRLGVTKKPRDSEALETLLSFIEAYVEAVQYPSESDNESLFPDLLRPWAKAVSPDALTTLRLSVFGLEE
jgi:hypothetical protein